MTPEYIFHKSAEVCPLATTTTTKKKEGNQGKAFADISHLELGISAQQGDGEILDSARLVRIVELVAGLHDVIKRQPFYRSVRSLVDRCRMQADCLVIRDVPPALALTGKQLRIEAPRNHRIDDQVTPAVDIVPLRDSEELSLATGETNPKFKQIR